MGPFLFYGGLVKLAIILGLQPGVVGSRPTPFHIKRALGEWSSLLHCHCGDHGFKSHTFGICLASSNGRAGHC